MARHRDLAETNGVQALEKGEPLEPVYNLGSGDFSNPISNAYVAVATNVELLIFAASDGRFRLDVGDVPAGAQVATSGFTQLADGSPVKLRE